MTSISNTVLFLGWYRGQWLRGMRHGFGIRTSAAYSIAAKHRSRSNNTHASLTSLRSNYAGDMNHHAEHNAVCNSSRSKDKYKYNNNDSEERGILYC